MILQILDRHFNTLATMDNSLVGAVHFFNDEFHQYLTEGVSTFKFSVLRNTPDVEHLIEGNYIYFTFNSRDFLMTIRRIEEDEWQIDIEAEDLCFDLVNESAGEYSATKAMKITEYLQMFIGNDTDVVVGLNEVYSYTRTCEWTGESSLLERILSLATKFDAEVEFVTGLNNDRSLKQITLNIYHKYDDTHQGVGTNRSDVELRLGENVSTVKRKTDITKLYTAIQPTGTDGLTINDIEETIKDDKGNVLYYTEKGSGYIFAPQANARFGREKSGEGAGYILMGYSYDTDSIATLYGNALAQLKKYSEPAITYEVEGYYDLSVGDIVSIADNRYTPSLLLEARVSEMITSFTQPESNKTVFSNYRVFESQVDSDLLKIMKDMQSDIDYAMQVAKTPIFKISTLGSTVFKNGDGEVELSAAVERANADVTSEYSVFNWVKEFKLGGIDEVWTAAHKNFGKSVTITPADFEDAAVFYYEAEGADGTLHTGGSASVVKLFDGEDGKTPIKGVDYFDGVDGTDGSSAYLHVRYSQNADGNPMTPDPTDAKYLGLQASQNPNASTVPADYDWSLVKGPQGIPGETVNGKTSYLHIKYSNDGGKTFTANSGETSGSYLGQYVDFTQADSTDVTKYAWSLIKGADGKDGIDGIAGKDGVGLKSTAITYAQSTSGTTAPTAGWTASVPTLIKGQYLWAKTVWTYTDSSAETGYTVSYNAKDGNTGADGKAGKDGVGISNTIIEYVGAVSGTSKPTSGWSTTIPTVPQGQYLWTRTTWQYTDNTSEQGFTNALMGRTGASGPKGDPGNQGIPGTPGADGRTPYFHTGYAWSADGTDRFTTVYPGENLITGGWTVGGLAWASGAEYNATNSKRTKFFEVNGNTQYVFSLDGALNTVNVFEYDADKTFIGTSAESFVVKTKITTKADTKFFRLVKQNNVDLTEKLKCEENTVPTIYTPAPSEDYANAYPTYIGTYTDYTEADSTSPAAYTWSRLLGEAGQDGKDGIAGKDGVGIKSTAVTYALADSGTTAPTTEWAATVPTLTKGKYLWTKSVWTYTDNSTETGYSVTYVAKDGNNGTDGIAGKDGVGIEATKIEYVGSTSGTVKPTTGWATTIPTVAAGSFLWTRTTLTYTDNTTEQVFTVAKMGNTGAQGPKGNGGANGVAGKDGKGIKATAITYQASTNGTTAPTGTWSTTVPTVAKGSYLWTRTIWTYTDNTTETGYAVAYMGTNGNNGTNGVAGKDGVGIKTTAITYAVSTSGTTAPTSGWANTPPSATAGQFMWTRTVWTYTDNSTETGYSVGKIGADGERGRQVYKSSYETKANTSTNYFSDLSPTVSSTNPPLIGDTVITPAGNMFQISVISISSSSVDGGGQFGVGTVLGNIKGPAGADGATGTGIASTAITYQASTSGTEAPTGTWSTSIPTVAANQYLWTRTVISYTNNTSSTAYSVGKMGANGSKGDTGATGPAGKGIESTAITYQASASGTSVPTGTWATSIPTVAANQFLWTRTVITYTDNTTTTGYSVGKMGANGATGPKGDPGTAGKGIKSTAVTYQAASSGTTVPTGTWVASPPSVAANQFLWTRTVITYTDNATTTSYSIGKIGANGTNGKDGSNGVSVTSVVEEYYVSTSPTSQAGGSWTTTVPNNADPNKYVWRRMKTTLSNGNVTYTDPALIQGMTGIYPYIGPTQPANPKEGQQWWKSDSSGNVTNFYVYKSGSWQGQTIQQSILNIVALNAVTITGSTITGTNINGSTFTNSFSIPVPVNNTGTGTTVIKDGKLIMEMAVKNSSNVVQYTQGHELSPQNGLYMWQQLGADPKVEPDYAKLTPSGLELYLAVKGIGGTLTAEALTPAPWKTFTYAAGYTTAENNPVQYRKVYLVDGSTELQLRGQVKPVSGKFQLGVSIPIGDLPAGFRPPRNELVQISDDTFKGARAALLTSGRIQIDSAFNAGYVSLGGIRIALE